MLGILANDHDTAFTTNDLALLAHGLHGRSYFHVNKPPLLSTPGNATAGQVVGRHLHRDLVTWQDPDEIHSELSGNMRQYRVSISNVYLECGVGHRLNDSAFHFDHVGFCQSVDPSWS